MGMKTIVLQPEELDQAAAFLQAGACVAFPTETVYGLGANALDAQAVASIFAAKGRPQDNPLIVHCCSEAQVLDLVGEVHPTARELMQKFWPGPLTLVLPRTAKIPPVVSAGLDTVAVRIPSHPVALRLIELSGLPLAAPSANLSGRPSPTTAAHVLADLDGRIRAIVDGGETGWGVESTVVDCTALPFRLLRPGGVTLEELQTVTPVEVDPGVYGQLQPGSPPRSPGMKYRHYSPNAKVVLVLGDRPEERILAEGQKHAAQGRRVGVMAPTEHCPRYSEFATLPMGSVSNLQEISANLYRLLREADALELDVLFVESLPETGLGMAIMNRLRRAAGDNIIWAEN
ncbi:MAG: threonylcarbamoyl-AMP synthase [Firmicutes bacterium]|jgi:L-threonylcarbamoyladenylate synthase|nr:threonylcarbamoyl-AMP synthase [Bacillota bacterium]